MARRRLHQPPPPQAAPEGDALAACNRAIDSVKAKADNFERLARATVVVSLLAGALIPVAIIASGSGHPFLWGKLAPALLAAIGAIAAGVQHFERPHHRWSLYRGYQRALEVERFRYLNESGRYADASIRDAVFADRVADMLLALHEDWSGLLPTRAELESAPLSHPVPLQRDPDAPRG